MRSKLTKKRLATVAGVLAVALAGIAYAFWTGAGGGSGSASADNPATANALTVTAAAPTNLVPGRNSTVNFTVDNSYAGALQLGTITFTGATPDADHAACDTSKSQLTMAPVVADQSIPGNANDAAVTATGTLAMGSSGNQDACKGATFTLSFTSS